VKKLKELHLNEKWAAFHQWQLQPHQVSPMSEERHVCQTCETEFQGNYCPRCGQSAKIGRYSFKTAFLSFLDVWGLGNRGMFRTLRDLLLRPGYMIRDYIKGMQMAYYPPFKMFFLFAALSLLVANGLNIKGYHSVEKANQEEALEKYKHDQQEIKEGEGADDFTYILANTFGKVMEVAHRFALWSPALFALSWLVIMSSFLYPFFHYCPNIPDLRYSEFVVAIVYTTNMYTIYSIVFDFFCLNILSTWAFLLTLIPLKQLSGYSWKRMFFYMMVAFVSVGIIIAAVLADLIVVLGWIYKKVPFKEGLVLVLISVLAALILFLFVRKITRNNKRRFELHQGHFRNVIKTISGRLPKRKGKVPPTPSEM
jgi:hypothetical protein